VQFLKLETDQALDPQAKSTFAVSTAWAATVPTMPGIAISMRINPPYCGAQRGRGSRAGAAAWVAGMNRWPDERWQAMEEQMAQAELSDDPAKSQEQLYG
jgi:hypothetical protein